ncbi:hypothetical protein NDU88_005703 [Pleurodeles waltl]|uniref:Synaptonemal complex protein 2 armadillo-repeat-like domain-containing protein n=1 Tax=Pleurodeles waltl TaxID=8319 RepID=A0AAV7VMJ8_PLEWA|nr:hypothetical protein NDU88_005703 [Pleurodeles waltl]
MEGAGSRVRKTEQGINELGLVQGLETFINAVFQGSDLQTINELVKEKNENPSSKFSKVMLTTLDKTVNKDLDRNAFDRVSMILHLPRRKQAIVVKAQM